MKAAEFVGGIVRNAPVIEGFGDHLGTGVAFYFGEAPPTVSSTLTLDASRVVPDGLFASVIVVLDGSVGTIQEIRALAEERVRTALSSVNLENSVKMPMSGQQLGRPRERGSFGTQSSW